MTDAQNLRKQRVAEAALPWVKDGMIVGVGTGSTVNYFIDALASYRDRIQTVASSEVSAARLRKHGIEVLDLNATGGLELYVDGADETTRDRHLIKGGGAALTREKIVAAAARTFVCIVRRQQDCRCSGPISAPDRSDSHGPLVRRTRTGQVRRPGRLARKCRHRQRQFDPRRARFAHHGPGGHGKRAEPDRRASSPSVCLHDDRLMLY